MRIFAIADLHLSFATNKPMDIFGPNWEHHHEKIRLAWQACVGPEDIVLVAGDISWALKLPDAKMDLDWIASLPGEKVFIKGNHDYWWSGISKVRKNTAPNMHFIQNDIVSLHGVVIGGTRLWDFPFVHWPFTGDRDAKQQTTNAKQADPAEADTIRARELQRLEMSLKMMQKTEGDLQIVMLHYPPISATPESNDLTKLISAYNIPIGVYGHIHALDALPPAADCVVDGCRYRLTACDALDFKPALIYEDS